MIKSISKSKIMKRYFVYLAKNIVLQYESKSYKGNKGQESKLAFDRGTPSWDIWSPPRLLKLRTREQGSACDLNYISIHRSPVLKGTLKHCRCEGGLSLGVLYFSNNTNLTFTVTNNLQSKKLWIFLN